jgi:hypothetical protein
MLRDTCSDFNVHVGEFVSEQIGKLKEDLDRYDAPPFDYELGEIAAIRRAIAAFEADRDDAAALGELLRVLEKVREFHDAPPSVDKDIPAFREALAAVGN